VSAASGSAAVPLGGGASEPVVEVSVPFYMFAVPAFCDVFGTGLAAVGQTYLDSAIWQMLRSSVIVFSAFCAKCFLGRVLEPFRWIAVGIVCIGLIIVGFAASLDAGGGSTGAGASGQIIGSALTIGAQLCSAFQMTFEEKIVTAVAGQKKVSAKKVVGSEGIWGGFFMCIVLGLMTIAPGNDVGGVYESLPDGLHMFTHSPVLLFLGLSYTVSIAVYNFVGITVGKKFTAVVRCLVDSSRTVTVWGTSLFLFYFVDERYGAGFTKHTWLTVIGFFVLVLGTAIYNDLVPQIIPEAWRGRTAVDEEPCGSFCRTASFVGVLGNSQLFLEGTEDARDVVAHGTSLQSRPS